MLNTTEQWFNNVPGGFQGYFENTFKRNTIGTLKAPASTVKRFEGRPTSDWADPIAQKYIDIIVYLKFTLLRKVKFEWLLDKDIEQLREAVCAAVQHAVLNNQVWQRVNASNISTGSFTISIDTVNWLLNKDVLGSFAWAILQTTGIDEYEIIGDDELEFFIETTNGNVQVIGQWDPLTVKELI